MKKEIDKDIKDSSKNFIEYKEENAPPYNSFDNLSTFKDNQKKKLKIIRKISRFLDYIILIVSVLALFLGVYAFWDTHQVMEIASNQKYQMYKPKSKEDTLSFDELKKLNPDVCGWIDVYGTKIDYPIVRGKNNSQYLNKTVSGEFSTAGSIFLDYRNEKDFSDFQNILYGHYMAERKMFGDMELFKDKTFFDNHKYGIINRDEKSSLGIEFFAFFNTLGTDATVLSPAKTKLDKKELIDYIYANATFSRDITFKDDENIIILDTCDLSITNGRYILAGKLTDTIRENEFKEVVKENKFSKLLSKTYDVNFLLLFIVIWILLVIIYLIYEKIRLKNKGKEAN